MALSQATIASLYKTAGARTTGTGLAGKRKRRKRHVWMDAYGEVNRGKPPTELIGSFEGKQGSMRRSRKGRTYRLANGQRFYVQDWTGTSQTVKFYTA
jgi:hypothetical protein